MFGMQNDDDDDQEASQIITVKIIPGLVGNKKIFRSSGILFLLIFKWEWKNVNVFREEQIACTVQ